MVGASPLLVPVPGGSIHRGSVPRLHHRVPGCAPQDAAHRLGRSLNAAPGLSGAHRPQEHSLLPVHNGKKAVIKYIFLSISIWMETEAYIGRGTWSLVTGDSGEGKLW